MTPNNVSEPTRDTPREMRGIDFEAAYTVLIRVWLRRHAPKDRQRLPASQPPPLP